MVEIFDSIEDRDETVNRLIDALTDMTDRLNEVREDDINPGQICAFVIPIANLANAICQILTGSEEVHSHGS